MSVSTTVYLAAYPYDSKGEKQFPELVVNLNHFVVAEEYSKYMGDEAQQYESLRFRCLSEGVDITFSLQAEHLCAIYSAIGEYLEKLPELVVRGRRRDVLKDDAMGNSREFRTPEVEKEAVS